MLRRTPDVEGPGLTASDSADALLLDEAAPWLADAADGGLAVIDDGYGALTLGAAAAGARGIRSHTDTITSERAVASNAGRVGLDDAFAAAPLGPETFAGARLVLLRLPRALDRLDEVAELAARHADPEAVIVAGGRLKHMTLGMNDVLRRHFDRLDVSLARGKSRVLIARSPKPDARAVAPTWPKHARVDEVGLTLVAHGGVFAGASLDLGTRELLRVLDGAFAGADAPTRLIDLACGNGVIGAWAAARRPALEVVASDRSAAAAASATLTAAANGLDDRVGAVQSDGLEHLPDSSERLVVLNPPFHAGAAITEGIAESLFADAARVLAPGGELWTVWNSHLRYRGRLERIVGPTRQIARTPKFTITASTRR
ncbi:class I SAM-dependent methyltransferase [Agromyces seonyuensis]|uniref:Methyltransferase n=1 Tax=Agromyces seonyuensis TaxID=2662446 RepID=A0A6I4NUG4_9MICO|nr:methyltransferase [Agromyces seonyuensis]MWB97920.1 methyltransferase [Agromyces seonyuensis]